MKNARFFVPIILLTAVMIISSQIVLARPAGQDLIDQPLAGDFYFKSDNPASPIAFKLVQPAHGGGTISCHASGTGSGDTYLYVSRNGFVTGENKAPFTATVSIQTKNQLESVFWVYGNNPDAWLACIWDFNPDFMTYFPILMR